jgi:hypothetical protein
LLLGISLTLASTVAYNGSAVLFAVAARRHLGTSSLLVSVGRRSQGLFAFSLSLLGWGLEVAALTMVSLTLVRVLNVAGLGILLGLTRWVLKEPLGRQEILGVVLISLGTVMAVLTPPRLEISSPNLAEWTLLLLVLTPVTLIPYAFRVLRRPVGATLGATASGLAYALSGIFNKGMADAFQSASILPFALLATGTMIFGLLSFVTELHALREGYASIVVPVVLAMHTVVPILCAPLLFDETWPAGLLQQVLLGGGITLALLGALVLSRSSGDVLAKR